MEKRILPVTYSAVSQNPPPRRPKKRHLALFAFLTCLNCLALVYLYNDAFNRPSARLPIHAQESLNRCLDLAVTPGPPSNFHERRVSDRFVPGTKPTLLRNARIWTGEHNGTEVIRGDVYMDKGIIQAVGRLGAAVEDMITRGEIQAIDVRDAWVTPGYWFCMSPALQGIC